MLPDGKPAPPPGFRVRRYWTEAEPPDPTTLHNALTHTDLRHACVLSPIIPTVVSHAIVPLPSIAVHRRTLSTVQVWLAAGSCSPTRPWVHRGFSPSAPGIRGGFCPRYRGSDPISQGSVCISDIRHYHPVSDRWRTLGARNHRPHTSDAGCHAFGDMPENPPPTIATEWGGKLSVPVDAAALLCGARSPWTLYTLLTRFSRICWIPAVLRSDCASIYSSSWGSRGSVLRDCFPSSKGYRRTRRIHIGVSLPSHPRGSRPALWVSRTSPYTQWLARTQALCRHGRSDPGRARSRSS